MNLWHCMVMRGWGGNKNGAGLKGSQTVKHTEHAHPHLSTLLASAGIEVVVLWECHLSVKCYIGSHGK